MTLNLELRQFYTTTNRPLSLGSHVEPRGKKSFVFARQALARHKFSVRLALQKQVLHETKTCEQKHEQQHDYSRKFLLWAYARTIVMWTKRAVK